MSQQDEQVEQAVGTLTIDAPPRPSDIRPAPEPNDKWTLPGGTAYVFRAPGHTRGVVRPVIVSDGFGWGASELDAIYNHLDYGAFPLVTELHRRGRDVILLGYNERSASLLGNAKTVTACIVNAKRQQIDDAPLVVGGFSMGGLVTRYALARMEADGVDHRTAVYFSFDSPHRGAVIPVGIQAFAHFVAPAMPFARQMNSPAARQMLWRHYDPQTGRIGVAPERTAFLEALDKVGGWPKRPRLLGVANGHGDGSGLLVPPGEVTLRVDTRLVPDTTFYSQAQGKDVVVAKLKRRLPEPGTKTVTTDGFPELDGAPGGSSRAYGMIAERLGGKPPGVILRHADVCFIPTVSAVAIRDIDNQKDLYINIDELPPSESDLHAFTCSTGSDTRHAVVTEELGTWLLNRLSE